MADQNQIPDFEDFKAKRTSGIPDFEDFKKSQPIDAPITSGNRSAIAPLPVPQALSPNLVGRSGQPVMSRSLGMQKEGEASKPIPATDEATFNSPYMPGLEQMSRPGLDAKAGGASKILRTAGESVAPIAFPIALGTAPIGTAVGLAGGIAGQMGGSKLAKGLGAGPGVSELAGDAAGAVTGGGLGNLAERGVAAATKINPVRALVKGLSPGKNNSDFSETSPIAAADIKEHNPKFKGDIKDLIPAAEHTINAHSAALKPYLLNARQMGVQVPGNSIIDATEAALPSDLPPSARKSIMDEARQAYGGKFSTDELHNRLKEKNAELNSFYRGSDSSQNAAVNAGKPQAVVKAQRDAIADQLYNALDPENQGAGPRAIQKRMGGVIEMRDLAKGQLNNSIAEKPTTPLEAASKVVQHGVRALTSPFHAGASALEGVKHPFIGPIDATMRKAFEGITHGNEPLPSPAPIATYGSRPLLGAPSIITQPPSDTSGPIKPNVPPEWSQPSHRLLLGPARGNAPGSLGPSGKPLVTPAPEGSHPVSGPLPRVFPTGSGNNRLLGPPQSRPGNPGPFGMSMGDDLVPVTHPQTGKVEYIPKWMLQQPTK